MYINLSRSPIFYAIIVYIMTACVPRTAHDAAVMGNYGSSSIRTLSPEQLTQFKERLVKRQTQNLSCRLGSPKQKTFRSSLFEELKNADGVPRMQLEPLLVKMVAFDSRECDGSTCQDQFDLRKENVGSFLDQSRQLVETSPQFKKAENAHLYKILLSSLAHEESSTAADQGVVLTGGSIPKVSSIQDPAIPTKDFLEKNLGEFGEFVLKQYSADYFFSLGLRFISARPLPGQTKIIQPSPMLDEIDEEGKVELQAYHQAFVELFSKVPPSPGTVYRAITKAPRELVDDLRTRAQSQKSTGLYFKGQAAITSTTRDPSFANLWLENAPDLMQQEVFSNFGNDFVPIVLIINQKTGVSIENLISKRMKEIILPAISSYEVVRFEDRSQSTAVPDPRFPTAKYIVYLEEKS